MGSVRTMFLVPLRILVTEVLSLKSLYSNTLSTWADRTEPVTRVS